MIPVKTKLETLLNSKDKNGKQLIYKPEEGGKIYLDIDGSVRCLGHILQGKNNLLYHKYEDESNIFRKTNAWSINHTILSNVDSVVYETRTHDYSITKERALEFGQFFHFQDTTELKVYIPLKYWDCRRKGMQHILPEEFKWRNRIGDSWYPVLKETVESPLMKTIQQNMKAERESHTVYPTSDRVFRAFKLCSFEHTKVVIVGQDPYADGTANGLAFGYLSFVDEGSSKPYQKSLDLIYKEVERDIYKGFNLNHDFSLESWAKQGVLLLNTVLTVRAKSPKSHYDLGWERFIRLVLFKLMYDETPKVFIAWGNEAKDTVAYAKDVWDKRMFIPFPHLILEGRHPSFDLHNKDQFGNVTPNYPTTFSGGNYFSKSNEFLKKVGRQEIKW